MLLSRAESAQVVGDLRRARRRQRVASIHWVDALYQVYITGLVAIVALVFVSSLLGDGEVSPSTLAEIRADGPAALGLLVAFAIFMGLRAGSRGGPLALEAADVRHVLLSPVDRGVALRGPALRQIRFLCFAGAGVGAGVGQLALRRLPGNGVEWMVFGALFGVTVVGLGFGAALVASGTKLRPWLATVLGGALVIWAAADLAGRAPTSPTAFVGRLPLWPLHAEPVSLLAVVLAAALMAIGLRLVAGTSLEAAERRTALVGQLKFAVTMQDLRTVLVLRRQLAQERPRSRPWISAMVRHPRFPVWQRGLRSVARWPVSRILRVLFLTAGAGLAFRGVWAGTTPLVVAAGLCLWVASLDAAEPLGQEVDHPGRTDSFPMDRGQLFVRHLPVVAVVSMVTGLLAAAVAAAPLGSPVPAGVAALIGITAGLMAGAGATVSVVQGAPDAVDVLSMSAPEIAGSRNVIRAVFPPGLGVVGVLPILAARAAEQGVSDPAPLVAASWASIPLAIVLFLVFGWVLKRDDIKQFMANAADQMSPTKAMERQAAEREAAEAREDEQLGESRRLAGLDPDDPEAGEVVERPKAQPRPKPKPKPTVSKTAPGTQGGTSAKPIGRRRDQQ